jgi:hypothetical protein
VSLQRTTTEESRGQNITNHHCTVRIQQTHRPSTALRSIVLRRMRVCLMAHATDGRTNMLVSKTLANIYHNFKDVEDCARVEPVANRILYTDFTIYVLTSPTSRIPVDKIITERPIQTARPNHHKQNLRHAPGKKKRYLYHGLGMSTSGVIQRQRHSDHHQLLQTISTHHHRLRTIRPFRRLHVGLYVPVPTSTMV